MATLIQYLQYILAQKESSLSNETKRVVLKEALQAYALDYIYNDAVYRSLNFYGGTCLHILYGLNRLSEDLDLDNTAQIPLKTLDTDLVAYFQNTFGYEDASAKSQLGENGICRITLKFPILDTLGLSPYPNEALHLKVEVSQHPQLAVLRRTPVMVYGRSFVPSHFSLETLMAGKMLACLERNFHRGKAGADIKGRDYYDLLWFMQRNIQPYAEKLEKEGSQPYTVQSAFEALAGKVRRIRAADLAEDLLPLFEQRGFITAWLEAFHDNFALLVENYLR